MTYLQIVESIQQVFPEIGRTQIKKDVNEIYREFAHRTELLKTTDQQAITTTTITYSLPADCDAVYAVLFYNSDDVVLTGSDTLKYEIDQGNIKFKGYKNEIITSISSSISYYVVHYVEVPDALSIDADTPEFDSQFHDAIVEGVLVKYFKRFPSLEKRLNDGSTMRVRDFQASKESKKEYEDYIRKGKMLAYQNQDNTSYSVSFHEV